MGSTCECKANALRKVDMNQMIAEWTEYCEGRSNRESSDFIGLLSRKWTDDELREILRLVPFRDAVIDNLKKVYQSSEDPPGVYLRPKRENAATPEQLVSSIVSFIDSQRRYLLQHEIYEGTRAWLEQSEIEVSFVTSHRFPFVPLDEDVMLHIRDEESELQRFRPGAWRAFTTGDCVDYRVMWGISEALYGLACDYYLSWYVLLPVIETEVDYGEYFEFWRKGGAYSLTKSKIIVASIWGESDG